MKDMTDRPSTTREQRQAGSAAGSHLSTCDRSGVIIASQAGLSFNDFLEQMTPAVLIIMGALLPLLWLGFG